MADVFPIVAGTDGSPKAEAAVDQAGAEALRRDLPLRLIYGFAPLYGYAGLDPMPADEILRACPAIVDHEVERVRLMFPELDVSGEVIVADPAVALVEESSKAAVVYVGARGLGVVRRLLLGSVSSKVATYAKCPVVVVRGPAGDPKGPVVVGVSPEDGSPDELEYAFNAARSLGVDVRVVQAHQHAAANVEFLPPDVMREFVASRALAVEERIRERVKIVQDEHPDVHSALDVMPGHAVDALLEASKNASLVVVGASRKGALASRFLGSVTQGVLGGAPIVAVIPAEG